MESLVSTFRRSGKNSRDIPVTADEARANLPQGTAPRIPAAQLEVDQRWLVESDMLPRDMSANAQATLKNMGVRFSKTDPADELFVTVKLPRGWTKTPDIDQPTMSYLCDSKGIRRALIYYRNLTSNRQAWLKLLP